MAMVQVESLRKGIEASSFDIVNFVSDATWKDLLIDLVRRNKFDPWDVDIAVIVEKYVEAVKSLRIMDLRVPANIILAASVLLRLKSEMLKVGDVETQMEVEDGQQILRPEIQVDSLSFRLRPALRRRVTLDELISALDDAMKIKDTRSSSHAAKTQVQLPVMARGIDIEEEMERVYGHVSSHADREGMTTFSYLLGVVELDDVLLQLFIPLLFLANKGRIALVQERFFDEVIVSLAKG